MKIRYFVKVFGVAVPVGLTFIDCVGCVVRVDGTSMRPFLNPRPDQEDYVFLNKWKIRNYEVARGEIISFICPKYPEQKFIKRIVGLEGDVVLATGYKESRVVVPEGHIWVVGDRGGTSCDSNTFGPVPLGLVTAKATHIVWPPSRWSSLEPGAVKNNSVI